MVVDDKVSKIINHEILFVLLKGSMKIVGHFLIFPWLKKGFPARSPLIDRLLRRGVNDGEALAVQGRIRAENEAPGVRALQLD